MTGKLQSCASIDSRAQTKLQKMIKGETKQQFFLFLCGKKFDSILKCEAHVDLLKISHGRLMIVFLVRSDPSRRAFALLCPTFRSTYSTLYLLILERKILDTESRFREIAHLHLNIIFNFKSYRFIISTHPTKFWGHGQLLNQYRPRF